NIGDNNLEIDSLNLIPKDLCSYKCFVICVDNKTSRSKASSNFLARGTSYTKALTSKLRRKLRTSIFAVPTDEILPSTTIALARRHPFSYRYTPAHPVNIIPL